MRFPYRARYPSHASLVSYRLSKAQLPFGRQQQRSTTDRGTKPIRSTPACFPNRKGVSPQRPRVGAIRGIQNASGILFASLKASLTVTNSTYQTGPRWRRCFQRITSEPHVWPWHSREFRHMTCDRPDLSAPQTLAWAFTSRWRCPTCLANSRAPFSAPAAFVVFASH